MQCTTLCLQRKCNAHVCKENAMHKTNSLQTHPLVCKLIFWYFINLNSSSQWLNSGNAALTVELARQPRKLRKKKKKLIYVSLLRLLFMYSCLLHTQCNLKPYMLSHVCVSRLVVLVIALYGCILNAYCRHYPIDSTCIIPCIYIYIHTYIYIYMEVS